MAVIKRDGWSDADQKAIREQLSRILNSEPFRQSQRRQRFLNTSSTKRSRAAVTG